jgi:hypothetical protein
MKHQKQQLRVVRPKVGIINQIRKKSQIKIKEKRKDNQHLQK